MSLSLLLLRCPACLLHLIWMVFKMVGRWPYSYCFVRCCLDLFNIARSIIPWPNLTRVLPVGQIGLWSFTILHHHHHHHHHAASTDFPVPLLPLVSIVHRSRQVFHATSCTSLMSLSLLLLRCPACLLHLIWMVFKMVGRWPYSYCFVRCCLDLFNIARSIIPWPNLTRVLPVGQIGLWSFTILHHHHHHHAASTDFPVPLLPLVSIVHRSRQVFHATSCTELLKIGSSWSSKTCTTVWMNPLEYIAYEFVLTSPAVSCMSSSSNLDGFQDGW